MPGTSPAAARQKRQFCSSLRQSNAKHMFAAAIFIIAAAIFTQAAAIFMHAAPLVLVVSGNLKVVCGNLGVTQRQCDMSAAIFQLCRGSRACCQRQFGHSNYGLETTVSTRSQITFGASPSELVRVANHPTDQHGTYNTGTLKKVISSAPPKSNNSPKNISTASWVL
ncbi:hypothetical protein DFH09DRAFT_1097197 [Mycena vulgaris]|nr:hypothetical protein DFH09DRAFT_1097197 [Mycena vulgaris]